MSDYDVTPEEWDTDPDSDNLDDDGLDVEAPAPDAVDQLREVELDEDDYR